MFSHNPSSTATVTSLSAVSASAFTILAQNRRRNGVLIWNSTAVNCYVKFGSAASSTDYSFYLTPGQAYESGGFVYTGVITGRLASSTGTMFVTEGEE